MNLKRFLPNSKQLLVFLILLQLCLWSMILLAELQIVPFLTEPLTFDDDDGPSDLEIISDPECDTGIPLRLRRIVTASEADKNLIKDNMQFYKFQSVTKKTIPKRIHQIYRNGSIPNVFARYIRSWVVHHPDYEYWFWDDRSARQFISDSYPKFLPLYDGYCHDLYRADALRYFILYHFGGIYTDMDYHCLKNVEPLLEGHQCLIVQENQPQAQLLYDRDDMVLNAWMASVPNHPFMKYLINRLPANARCGLRDVLKSTGPIFVYNSMKLHRSRLKCGAHFDCGIHILNDKLMMPEGDNQEKTLVNIRGKCRRLANLSKRQRSACNVFRARKFRPAPVPDAKKSSVYATHKFLHIGNLAKNYRANAYTEIHDLVPYVRRYEDGNSDE